MSYQPTRATTAQFMSLIRRQQRGRIKVYLGYAPGVGKTYEMLEEGQRLRRLGVDVVTGIVEPYGRAEITALADSLEQVPCRRIPFRDLVWQQLDLNALLERRPTVVLVDELAKLNTPDSRHAARYQDVEELLSAGIHVIATLDLQYLEGLHVAIPHIPSVKVKRRVPEQVVRMADQIVSIDPPAEILRDRFVSGCIYPSGQVAEGLQNFFTLENLSELHACAQKGFAELLERPTYSRSSLEGRDRSQRLLVCLSLNNPDAAQRVRRCAELADRLGAAWYAMHIDEVPEAKSRPLGQELGDTALALAKQLGGTPIKLKSSDIVGSIASFVAEYGITHILIGRTQQPWYRRWLSRSVLDRILHAIRGVDVTVVDSPCGEPQAMRSQGREGNT